jgi:hypothetical protein
LFGFKGLSKTDNTNSNSYEQQSRQSQSVGAPISPSMRYDENSSSNSEVEYVNNRDNIQWKRTGYQTVSFNR